MPSSKQTGGNRNGRSSSTPSRLPDEAHPDYVDGLDAGAFAAEPGFTPNPDGPLPPPFPPVPPLPPRPFPPEPWPGPTPRPPEFPPIPEPFPRPPGRCGAVSGRYRLRPAPPRRPTPPPTIPPWRPWRPVPVPEPIAPINQLEVIVRVDVDRFTPQNRISVEITRFFPRRTTHAVAEVVSDRCSIRGDRTIRADVVYLDGDPSDLGGTTLVFKADGSGTFGYRGYALEVLGATRTRTYDLVFESRYFDPIELEVDWVDDADPIVETYDTTSHPNRPADLPPETLDLVTIFQRAGFDATLSPGRTAIPRAEAGANGRWSDAEMHDAMVTYWSRFADRPQWAMWVLYARQHDWGYGLGGIMFDDIGDQHRQGTAIFTESFIRDAPNGDPNPDAWRARMQLWTAVHEIGHGFNLAHSWQKALGTADGAPGDPWIPLANEPEARSFMNYPDNVQGGQQAFFADFRFRFSDDELVFLRHAPRRFVRMGASDWFVDHGFEAPSASFQGSDWRLVVRGHRPGYTYSFLEPVNLELKLSNTSATPRSIDDDLLADGKHVTVFVRREGGRTRRWRPMITRCHLPHHAALAPGESIYGAHMISAGTGGWIIDEPGFYEIQAAVDTGGEIVVSNVLRIFVAPPTSMEDARIAPDYFTENVGRTLAFSGAPSLEKATSVLAEVAARSPQSPAARHAIVALTAPRLSAFKTLAPDGDHRLKVSIIAPQIDEAGKRQREALLGRAGEAADTLGHIRYFDRLRALADAYEGCGADKEAREVAKKTVEIMKERGIKPSVVKAAEERAKKR